MSIPLLGYPIAALGIREVRMALIGLPALLIALGAGAHLWRESGRDRTPEPACRKRRRLMFLADPRETRSGDSFACLGLPGTGSESSRS